MPKISVRVGDCIDVMRAISSDSIDSVVSDPPYNLEFVARSADARSIGGGPVLVESQEPWGFPHLLVDIP